MTLLDIYEDIKKTLIHEEEIKSNLKEIEEDIKEEYAQIKGFKNKKGETDKRLVKFSEVKSAAKNVLFEDNSFEVKIENYETYKNDIQNGEETFPIERLKRYFEVEDIKKEVKTDLKDIEVAATTNEELNLDQKSFSYLIKLAKQELKNNEGNDNNDDDYFLYIKEQLEQLKKEKQ